MTSPALIATADAFRTAFAAQLDTTIASAPKPHKEQPTDKAMILRIFAETLGEAKKVDDSNFRRLEREFSTKVDAAKAEKDGLSHVMARCAKQAFAYTRPQ